MNAHTGKCAYWIGFTCDCIAPVPSGEVETPCATCGGTRKDITSNVYASLQSPCPDCGVETPEAELIAFDRAEFRRWWAQIQVGGTKYEVACPDEVSLLAQEDQR